MQRNVPICTHSLNSGRYATWPTLEPSYSLSLSSVKVKIRHVSRKGSSPLSLYERSYQNQTGSTKNDTTSQPFFCSFVLAMISFYSHPQKSRNMKYVPPWLLELEVHFLIFQKKTTNELSVIYIKFCMGMHEINLLLSRGPCYKQMNPVVKDEASGRRHVLLLCGCGINIIDI